jgi:uncharacterized membrane protein YdbT with pleckstrin-like domain
MASSRLGGEEDRYLTRNEAVVITVRRHPVVLVRPSLRLLLAIVISGYLVPPAGSEELETAVSLVLLALLFALLWAILEWWSERIVLTDKRIFETRGLLTRKVASMPLSKVTDMTYERTPQAKFLGYGEFRLESAGQDQGLNHIRFVPEPDWFYRTVMGQVFTNRG